MIRWRSNSAIFAQRSARIIQKLAKAFLSIEEIFGPEIRNNGELVQDLGRALSDLHHHDLRSVIASRLN